MQATLLMKIRRFFSFRIANEAYSQIAEETAHRCLEIVVKRLNRDCDSWSEAKLHGYLRAVAVPCIDSALMEISSQYRQPGKAHAKVEGLVLDTLEQMVIEKLKKQHFAHSAGAAAA
jgi:hypothetical protein